MGGKNIFQYFLSQLCHWVIILYIYCGHQEPLLICGALKSLLNAHSFFTFKIRDHTYSVCYRVAVPDGYKLIFFKFLIL